MRTGDFFCKEYSFRFFKVVENKILYEGPGLTLSLERLAREVVENHGDFSSSVIVGLQPRGTLLAERLAHKLRQITGNHTIPFGKLDITFYRDDFRRRDEIAVPSTT
jgi:pyrimidine operon attenuation protein/uracil phosphoribosyltransferase